MAVERQACRPVAAKLRSGADRWLAFARRGRSPLRSGDRFATLLMRISRRVQGIRALDGERQWLLANPERTTRRTGGGWLKKTCWIRFTNPYPPRGGRMRCLVVVTCALFVWLAPP